MKKVLAIVLIVIIVLGLAAGGAFFFVTSTPEYALKKTLEDVEESGVEGLKAHLSVNMLEKVETVQYWTDNPTISSILSFFTQEDVVEFFISQIAEIDWEIKEVLRGENRTEVVLAFDYINTLSGTLELTMIKEDREWKIDSFKFPNFDNIELWQQMVEDPDFSPITPAA